MNCPVIGGHSGVTIVPLISQCRPPVSFPTVSVCVRRTPVLFLSSLHSGRIKTIYRGFEMNKIDICSFVSDTGKVEYKYEP